MEIFYYRLPLTGCLMFCDQYSVSNFCAKNKTVWPMKLPDCVFMVQSDPTDHNTLSLDTALAKYVLNIKCECILMHKHKRLNTHSHPHTHTHTLCPYSDKRLPLIGVQSLSRPHETLWGRACR